jgi:hypothetical protein
MKYLIGLMAALAVLITGGSLVWSADAAVSDPPPGSTIIDVSGDRDHGFVIEHYDGTVDYPPTLSEGVAECGEYDARVERVRCRTEVRIWLRELGHMEGALDYAHARR